MILRLNTHLHILVVVLVQTFFLLSSGLTWADSVTVPIEYAYPNQSIWTTKRNAKGEVANPLLKFAEAVFTHQQIPWTAKPYPAERMFDRLEKGVSNFSILVMASRLKASCIFSKTPITYGELRVYRTAGTTPVLRKEDLRGKTIITIHGYSYGNIGRYLGNKDNDVTIFEAPGHLSAFKMLGNNRAKYLLDYSGPSNEILSDHPIPGLKQDVLTRLDVFLVLSNKYPDAREMMDRLEKIANNIDVTEWGLNKP